MHLPPTTSWVSHVRHITRMVIKSQTRPSSTLSTPSSLPHLRVMSEALLNQDNVYLDCLAGTIKVSLGNECPDIGDEAFAQDWSEVDGTVRDFGGPEFADHMSGHMFMRGSPIESKSTKCLRLADHIPLLSDNDLGHCVRCLTSWRNHIQQSQLLLDITRKFDGICADRLKNNKLNNSVALPSAFVLAHLGISGFKMPPLVLNEGILLRENGSISRTVLHLLLCSLCRANDGDKTVIKNPGQDLEDKVLESFDLMSREEVAVAYQGLIDCGASHDALKQKITGTYGFRL